MGESSWGKQPLNGTLAKFRYGNADAALASVLTTNKGTRCLWTTLPSYLGIDRAHVAH
jgi:hypothetical protein